MIDQPEISLLLVGGMLFVVGYMLWRTSVLRHRVKKQDPSREMQQELEARSHSPESVINEMEVRLHNYGREVEGRVETTLSVLDRLIVDADKEIGRLEELLKESRGSMQSESKSSLQFYSETSLTEEELKRLPELFAAGLTDEEIGKCFDCDSEVVAQYRNRFKGDNTRDAA